MGPIVVCGNFTFYGVCVPFADWTLKCLSQDFGAYLEWKTLGSLVVFPLFGLVSSSVDSHTVWGGVE